MYPAVPMIDPTFSAIAGPGFQTLVCLALQKTIAYAMLFCSSAPLVIKMLNLPPLLTQTVVLSPLASQNRR